MSKSPPVEKNFKATFVPQTRSFNHPFRPKKNWRPPKESSKIKTPLKKNGEKKFPQKGGPGGPQLGKITDLPQTP